MNIFLIINALRWRDRLGLVVTMTEVGSLVPVRKLLFFKEMGIKDPHWLPLGHVMRYRLERALMLPRLP